VFPCAVICGIFLHTSFLSSHHNISVKIAMAEFVLLCLMGLKLFLLSRTKTIASLIQSDCMNFIVIKDPIQIIGKC
jgi:hypothetical protein